MSYKQHKTWNTTTTWILQIGAPTNAQYRPIYIDTFAVRIYLDLSVLTSSINSIDLQTSIPSTNSHINLGRTYLFHFDVADRVLKMMRHLFVIWGLAIANSLDSLLGLK